MNIFREYTENQKRAKDRIKREKDADKAKHDRMLDSARTRDTRRKNNMTESEIHVRLDHLDGDSRQKKAGAVMRKHERAGHIEYVGNTDKGVVFKAKSKQHADRLHKDLKPHATGVEHTNEEMSPESQKAHRGMFKAAQKKKDDSAAQAEREKRLKAKGWVKNDRGGMSKVAEAKSAQDPDIKDREGTQPAAYHKGLKKTTKAKRDAHFKKHGKKDDDNASAYKDAPGDKKARKGNMPKSKYTKFVDNMMKEGTDFAAHRAKPKLSPSDQKKMAKVADMLRKEREKKASMKEEAPKKDHQTISYVTHGGQKGKVEVHKDKAFKALNHYRKNNKSAQFESYEENIDEAMGDAAHKAAVKHITDLGKKNNRTVGQQRMHIDNFPQKHDAKTRAAAKTINKNQFGGWKVGKDGKTTQKEETGSYRKDSGWKKVDKKDKTPPMDKARELAKKGLKKEDTGSYRKDSGWKKIDKKDKTPPMDKAKELAKKGQKSVMKEDAGKSLSAKAAKSGISVGTLKKVYNRGVAAWKTGHRPGTTPSQWGHARVNAFITKKKKGGLNHDKDLA
jgi:hypothetical protein